MKISFLLLFGIIATFTAISQTTKVTTHNKVTIVTDPSQGEKSFKSWGVFPDKSKPVRRIKMNVTLAYPEDRPIAHWDYMDRIKILRKGGVKGKSLDYEIGRMLTPYGSNFKEGWNFTWTVDVTDFAAFLTDSVEIEYTHSGYESPDLGWDLTIDFDFLFGPPVADFISVQQMWNGSFAYGNPEKPVETQLSPIKIKKAKGSEFGRFRIQHTGHGMDRPSGCSEFCSRWRELLVDGLTVDHRNMWKDCGNNPLFPQGGTWIFDRAYWCPGDLQLPDIIDIPLNKSSLILDLNMEPFTATDPNQPREQITSYFFQFAGPNHANDVSIEEIISPNLKSNYIRYNPAGFNAQIIIKNLGKENLRTLEIIYKTIGFKEKVYRWEGDMPFYATDTVTLPGVIDAGNEINTFSVILSNPNGVDDEWDLDNQMESKFTGIPTLPDRLVVDFLTNNKPKDNSLFIVNSKNDTVFSRLPENLEPATRYSDTLLLPEGEYFLMLTDTVGDGLEFWFQPKSGFGKLLLKDTFGNLLHLFESDCGNGQFYSFRTSKTAAADTTTTQLAVNLFPRMVTDYITVYTTTNKKSSLRLRLTRDGEFVEQHEYTGILDSQTGLDVRHLPGGRYVMEIYVNGNHFSNRRFNKL